MMNKIYDFEEIDTIRSEQKRLIGCYVLLALGFVAFVALACALIKSNVLLTVTFGFALLTFVLYSIVYWKIKYGILKERRMFLDNLETGMRNDYVGIFEGISECSTNEDEFCTCVFTSIAPRSFLIDIQSKIEFIKGKKYHLECVGNYVVQWETVE